jgi:dipeptidyl aminopeptidase/acylaminoacyl peptidase
LTPGDDQAHYPDVYRPSTACMALLSGIGAAGAQTSAPAPPFSVAKAVEFEVGIAAFAPKWSPDGKWIAFSFPKSNGIGLVRPDGSGRRTLTDEPGSGYKFAWSPDGRRIVFRREDRARGPRQYSFAVVEAATGNVESATGTIAEAQPPVWQTAAEGMRWISHAPTGLVEGPWIRVPATEKKSARIQSVRSAAYRTARHRAVALSRRAGQTPETQRHVRPQSGLES